jgi:hypothetical protein
VFIRYDVHKGWPDGLTLLITGGSNPVLKDGKLATSVVRGSLSRGAKGKPSDNGNLIIRKACPIGQAFLLYDRY